MQYEFLRFFGTMINNGLILIASCVHRMQLCRPVLNWLRPSILSPLFWFSWVSLVHSFVFSLSWVIAFRLRSCLLFCLIKSYITFIPKNMLWFYAFNCPVQEYSFRVTIQTLVLFSYWLLLSTGTHVVFIFIY